MHVDLLAEAPAVRVVALALHRSVYGSEVAFGAPGAPGASSLAAGFVTDARTAVEALIAAGALPKCEHRDPMLDPFGNTICGDCGVFLSDEFMSAAFDRPVAFNSDGFEDGAR